MWFIFVVNVSQCLRINVLRIIKKRQMEALLLFRASIITNWTRPHFSPHSANVQILKGVRLRSARQSSHVPPEQPIRPAHPSWGSRPASDVCSGASPSVCVCVCAGVCVEATAARSDSTSGTLLAAFQQEAQGREKNAPVALQLHRQRDKCVNASC